MFSWQIISCFNNIYSQIGRYVLAEKLKSKCQVNFGYRNGILYICEVKVGGIEKNTIRHALGNDNDLLRCSNCLRLLKTGYFTLCTIQLLYFT